MPAPYLLDCRADFAAHVERFAGGGFNLALVSRRDTPAARDSREAPKRFRGLRFVGVSGIMLSNLSAQLRECYQRAAECERRALEVDPSLRQDFIDMAERWMHLARCYDFSEQLGRFIAKPTKTDGLKT